MLIIAVVALGSWADEMDAIPTARQSFLFFPLLFRLAYLSFPPDTKQLPLGQMTIGHAQETGEETISSPHAVRLFLLCFPRLSPWFHRFLNTHSR